MQRYYLVGWSKDRQHWRILKIDRSEPDELSLSEDPVVYTQTECTSVLQTVADGNMSTGGLQLVTKAHGVVGKRLPYVRSKEAVLAIVSFPERFWSSGS